jgi:hypothetical protein
MSINKERILPIRLICKIVSFMCKENAHARKLTRISQLVLQHDLLLLTHGCQNCLILLIQPIITDPQRNAHKDLRSETPNDRDLPALIPWLLGRLEGLRAEDVAHAEGHERQGVDCHLFGVTGKVGGVPREEEHEGCAEGAGEVAGEEKPAFGVCFRDAGWVEAVHWGTLVVPYGGYCWTYS